MQQIVHQLRTRGDMSLKEISCEIPWLETALDIGIDIDKEQPPPRAFKTHAWRNHLDISKDAKYIVVARNPVDSAVSFYNFMNGWFFERDSIGIDTFIKTFYMKRGKPKTIMENPSYWEHLASWWPLRQESNVLWLHYEDMKENHRDTVEKVAKFLDFDPADEELIDLVVSHSTFDFMKEHVSQFDENVWKQKRNTACGLSADAGMQSSKVMNGNRARRASVSDDVLKALQTQWEQVITAQFGFGTYDDMLAVGKN